MTLKLLYTCNLTSLLVINTANHQVVLNPVLNLGMGIKKQS
jgi:hypothetical protein